MAERRLPLPADRLRTLADRHGTPVSTVAHAVVLLVLSRWTGQDEVRISSGLEVVRADLSTDPTFDELVRLVEADTEQNPPAFSLSEVDGNGQIVLSTDLFNAAMMERLAEHVVMALDSVARDPGLRVSQVGLLSPDERETILHKFNDTTVPFADNVGVHELVQAHAVRTPDAVAVVCGDVSLTYRVLNGQANRLARHLRDSGIERGSLVGVCLDRGPDLIVAVLAVLKAGAAYVPLDPGYPAQRLEFMVRDTGLRLVITSPELRDRTPATAQVFVGNGWPEDTDLPPAAGPTDLACVMYTSGSTGIPKGVMVEHRSICRLVDGNWFADVTETDAVAQASSFSFDAFTLECWLALASGASVVILDNDTVLDAQALKAAIRRYKISTMWLTASLFNQHVRSCPDMFAGMKTVMYGGEAVDRSVADGLVAGQWAPGNLVNGYGPTEATTFTTCHRVRPDDRPTMPIGRPIANTEVLVMDRNGDLAPIGVPGELWVGGPGVARGYWNRPELTAERFVDHPFTPGARMYRTGDLVRWLPTGDLEFLGRIDQQVKIRGFRIELPEIESVLTEHDTVTAAVVDVREDTPGDKRLVAYCVATGTAADLTAWCRARLPDYMMPSAFVFLDSFPLTPNGKLDRRALPAPDHASQYEAPRTKVEATIAGIWAEVLGVDRVGIFDNFIELGGHSLVATQIMSRIRRELAVELRMRVIFEAPTVAGLAERVGAAKPAPPPIRRRGTQ